MQVNPNPLVACPVRVVQWPRVPQTLSCPLPYLWLCFSLFLPATQSFLASDSVKHTSALVLSHFPCPCLHTSCTLCPCACLEDPLLQSCIASFLPLCCLLSEAFSGHFICHRTLQPPPQHSSPCPFLYASPPHSSASLLCFHNQSYKTHEGRDSVLQLHAQHQESLISWHSLNSLLIK